MDVSLLQRGMLVLKGNTKKRDPKEPQASIKEQDYCWFREFSQYVLFSKKLWCEELFLAYVSIQHCN